MTGTSRLELRDMMRALCDAFNMGTEKLKRVSGLVEWIDTMATHLPQATTSSADYIQDVESEDARGNPLEKKELVSKGNDIGAITRGEHNFNAPDFPTIHATVEQSIVKHFLNLSLSQDGYLDIPCDKEKLCDDAYVVSVPHLMTEIDIVVLKQPHVLKIIFLLL
jgi:hypothetical protein